MNTHVRRRLRDRVVPGMVNGGALNVGVWSMVGYGQWWGVEWSGVLSPVEDRLDLCMLRFSRRRA